MRALALLALSLLLLQDEALREFTCREGNFKVQYPSRFRMTKSPREEIQLAIARATSAIFFCAAETEASVEGIVEDIHEDQKLLIENLEVVKQEEIRVAGERAIQVRKTFKQTGVKGTMRLVVFTHQGIAYRVIGILSGGDAAEFDEDYQTCLDNLAYLGERKEWVEKFEGRPVPTALMGGLATFDLRRPRWTETTLDGEHEFDLLDRASFGFISDGAWINFRVRESTGGPEAAIEDLRHYLSARVQNSRAGELPVKVATGEARAFEMTGEIGGIPRILRGAVVVRDGIRIEVWLESLHSLREVVKADWESMMASLDLQSRLAPKEPPAYPSRKSPSGDSPDPGMAAVLGGASKIFEAGRGQILGMNLNGTTALVTEDGVVYRQNLPNGRRQKLELDPAPTTGVVWSRDGKRVAYINGDQVIVAQLDPLSLKIVPIAAESVEFGPGEEELLVCTRPAPTIQSERTGPNRLQVVAMTGEPKKTLVEFPFCRVSHPAWSPQARQVAFVSNRDGNRRTAGGGHLYVASADGSDARQLTKDPEEIASVAWSADGRAIYAVRRLSVGSEGELGLGGSSDLYRIQVEKGEAVNLTRSDHVEALWMAGEDFVIRVSDWNLPPAQRGVFRIAAPALEKATAGRPVPPVFDRLRWGKEVADRVSAATGGPKPLRELVPTQALIEAAAKAFAESTSERCGLVLDFSAESLDRLWMASFNLDLPSGRHPILRFGLGAYYGETLRRVAGAEWALDPVPFGDWGPGDGVEGTPMVDPVLPFSAALAVGLDSESIGPRSCEEVTRRDVGMKILLVYPPASGAEAVRKATGPAYYEALKLAGKGEARAAVDLLIKEMLKAPRNRALAVEVIALCEAGGLAQEAASLAERAVAGGIEVPEVLVRHADALMATDPKKALVLYRKAVEGPWPPAEAFIKLGKAYGTIGRKDIADSCWRRAFTHTYRNEHKSEIRRLMGLPEPSATKD